MRVREHAAHTHSQQTAQDWSLRRSRSVRNPMKKGPFLHTAMSNLIPWQESVVRIPPPKELSLAASDGFKPETRISCHKNVSLTSARALACARAPAPVGPARPFAGALDVCSSTHEPSLRASVYRRRPLRHQRLWHHLYCITVSG